MSLFLDWCSIKAAKYAVEHWHYSRSYTIHPCVAVGAWEDNIFLGAVIFARGANKNIGAPYGLSMLECIELVRVALSGKQQAPTSKIVAGAVKMLQTKEPAIRLLVSYADMNKGHIGTLYQAMNWIYAGETPPSYLYRTKLGSLHHQREVSMTGWKPYFGEPRRVPKIDDCEKIPQLGKHRYLYPLDRAMRKQIAPLAKPYPKREPCGPSVEGDTSDDQLEGAGSIPATRS